MGEEQFVKSRKVRAVEAQFERVPSAQGSTSRLGGRQRNNKRNLMSGGFKVSLLKLSIATKGAFERWGEIKKKGKGEFGPKRGENPVQVRKGDKIKAIDVSRVPERIKKGNHRTRIS